jgi:hypothetical protein
MNRIQTTFKKISENYLQGTTVVKLPDVLLGNPEPPTE